MSSLAAFLSSLSPKWKATALGGTLAVGVTIGVTTVGVSGIPAEVRAHGDSIRAISRRVEDNRVLAEQVEDQYDRIICILTLPDSVPPIQAQRACP